MSTEIQSGDRNLGFEQSQMPGAGVVISCQSAKYHPITDIIKFQGLGVKVSNTILRIFGVIGAVDL